MKAFAREPIEIIPEWLAATRDVEITTGLSREEALVRARKLRHLIRDGRVSPKDVELDEEGKDVLHALVKLLEEDSAEPTPRVASDAEKVYSFLGTIGWFGDEFDESAALQRQAAIAGWIARGTDLASVVRRRQEMMCEPAPELVANGKAFLARILLSPESDSCEGVEVVFGACAALRARADDNPSATLDRALALYRWLSRATIPIGFLDESVYFIGTAALWAGISLRLLGRSHRASEWFDLAEDRFRRVVNSAQQLAKLAYARASVMYNQGRRAEVLPIFRALKTRFERLGMNSDAARAEFSAAITLSGLGRCHEAQAILRGLVNSEAVMADSRLHIHAHVFMADLFGQAGDRENAEKHYAVALRAVAGGRYPVVAACLKWSIGDAYRAVGEMEQALYLYRLALGDYLAMGARSLAAEIRLTIAEASLDLGRDREAEQEILTALPVLEEEGCVNEGFAAVALLKESMRRRKTDPRALRELREHLKSNT